VTAVVVVSFNYNDRRHVRGPDEVDSVARLARVGRSSARPWPENFATYRLLRRLLERGGLRHSHAPGPADASELRARVPPASYRRNLEQFVALAKSHGAALIFLQLGDHPIATRDLRIGVAAFQEGDADAAIEALERSVRRRNAFADVSRIWLSRAYEMRGERAQAAASRMIAASSSVHGGSVLYRDSVYLAIMREVAHRGGVPLVDAAAKIDEDPAHYYDLVCHFDANGHRIVADLLEQQVRPILAEGERAR
jgi:lysophospholipase L1-like esterase